LKRYLLDTNVALLSIYSENDFDKDPMASERPDHLLGTDGSHIPVECKSRNCNRAGPHESEIVSAYCLTVEEHFGVFDEGAASEVARRIGIG
jgi:hypothetical protein